jgi:penicillin-binding protein 1A
MRRKRRHRGSSGRPAFLALGVLAAVTAIGALSVVGYVVGLMASAPSLDRIKPVDPGATSVIYAANGERLGFIQNVTLRTPISRDEIPTNVRNATVAIEDRRFYSHKGIDVEGVARAALKNITSGRTVEGGSTLTMQLIKNLYDPNKRRTFTRKVREAKLAQELEDRHPGIEGKRWILDQYLNSVPYGTVGGQTAVGIQAAARIYFDKPASELKLDEAALLAGLPQAPSLYNPFNDEQLALRRRNAVLRAMARAGYIEASTAQTAMEKPLGVEKGNFYTFRREGYFFDYVKDQLIRQYGEKTVEAGGLRVYTTIDLDLQKLAREAINKNLADPSLPRAALVSIDPRNGHILAMASSIKYGDSKFNVAAQGHRQPGSTFKVMGLMTALRRNISPESTSYMSKPLNFTAPGYGPIDVKNFGNSYNGRITLARALVKSDNSVFQQLALDLGPEAVRETAYDMGITSKLDAYPAEVLGGLTRGVSPLEMTRAYTTINTGGYRIRPVAVTKVVFPDGSVHRELARQKRTKVFTDGQTAEAIKLLEDNVEGGTGTRAQIGCPAAGKTGTTNNNTDAWFDGFTRGLNTAVWVGYPNANVSMSAVPGWGEMTGGAAPAAIWHDFMAVAATRKGRCGEWPKPKEPFNGTPFFGKYAQTGGSTSSTGSYSSGTGTYTPAPSGPAAEGNSDTQSKPDSNGGYDPDLYESPPQQAPQVKTPPQAQGPPAGTAAGGDPGGATPGQ